MQVVDREMFNWYVKEVDSDILGAFKQQETVFNSVHESHQWHLESAPKRFIYFLVYGLLLKEDVPRQRILDIGGGLTSLSTLLSRKHDYSIIDIGVDSNIKDVGDINVIQEDWHDYDIAGKSWDLIIANDIFPNVDQRLELLLHKFLPHCGLLSMSLTYNNRGPKWYKTKRVDGTETLYMLSWTGMQVKNVLELYRHRIGTAPETTPFFVDVATGTESIFPNGRQVCVVSLNGNLCPENFDKQ